MSDQSEGLFVKGIDGWNQGVGLIDKLFSVTRPGAVFSEPVTAGEHTVITASEVTVGLGFGYGFGGGDGSEQATGEGQAREEDGGVGGGGGGGGGSLGRPVAVVDIGPSGVRVEPVVDVTKIGLALFTTLGAMFMMLSRMRKAATD